MNLWVLFFVDTFSTCATCHANMVGDGQRRTEGAQTRGEVLLPSRSFNKGRVCLHFSTKDELETEHYSNAISG